MRWLLGPVVAAWLGWAQPTERLAGAWQWTDGRHRWSLTLQPDHIAQAMYSVDQQPDSAWAGRGVWRTTGDTLVLASKEGQQAFPFKWFGDSLLVGRHMYRKVALYAPPPHRAPQPRPRSAT